MTPTEPWHIPRGAMPAHIIELSRFAAQAYYRGSYNQAYELYSKIVVAMRAAGIKGRELEHMRDFQDRCRDLRHGLVIRQVRE